jgi:hypothetical protein
MALNLWVPEKVGTLFSRSENITFSIRSLLHGLSKRTLQFQLHLFTKTHDKLDHVRLLIKSVMGGCAVPSVIINNTEKKDIHHRTASVSCATTVTRLLVLFKICVNFKQNFKQRKAHGSAHKWVLAARNDSKKTRKCIQPAKFQKILCF